MMMAFGPLRCANLWVGVGEAESVLDLYSFRRLLVYVLCCSWGCRANVDNDGEMIHLIIIFKTSHSRDRLKGGDEPCIQSRRTKGLKV